MIGGVIWWAAVPQSSTMTMAPQSCRSSGHLHCVGVHSGIGHCDDGHAHLVAVIGYAEVNAAGVDQPIPKSRLTRLTGYSRRYLRRRRCWSRRGRLYGPILRL